jgi:hypothetical protein
MRILQDINILSKLRHNSNLYLSLHRAIFYKIFLNIGIIIIFFIYKI